MRRPRAMVLDEVWRRLDGVEPLSGPHGGPLRRTVKLILDPLVIRPVQNPQCAGSMLSADGAVLLATRIHAAADVLRATAAWFTLLKQTRRGLRITEGNAQDLYFQRCFELATVSGMPDPAGDRAAAESALREIHGLSAGRTTQALKEYLSEPARVGELTELIQTAWRRRPLTEVPDHTDLLAGLLEACAATRFEDSGAVDLDAVIDASVGTHTGIRLWLNEIGCTAQEFGLTLYPLPLPPQVGFSASTATLGLPLDRTIHERVFTVLQASSERADLPPIPELVDAEIARACAPWALLDESLRVAAAAGAALAVNLCPLGDPRLRGHSPNGDAAPTPRAPLTLASSAAGLMGAAVSLTGTAAGPLDIPSGLPGAAAAGVAGLTTAAAGTVVPLAGSDGSLDTAAGSMAGSAGAPGGLGAAAASTVRTAELAGATADLPDSAGRGPVPVAETRRAREGAVGPDGGGAAARVINGRWQREAYVLQARRMAVRADAVDGPLGAIAADLRVPWRSYLRRLWARLHGRDVRDFPVYAADELWDLLDGVARSVILDHRMRVKRALAVIAAADPGERESRAG
ncbi:hypothetical protein [Nocardia aurantiaca]|uniref:hypothetical protein n=1 Tax=Nocardia aurantiaca TaxID=2675850 RepID=UPI001E43DF1C|nr:hypothetical protein [Nocardia aurantiaca]